MQRVIQISLNRNSWSIEQDAYAKLEIYLAEASSTLSQNPDREEILLDLEQAIADQCKSRMPPHAAVISLKELEPALEVVGPVDASPASDTPPKTSLPLQQDSQGAWISGVCCGLARHLNVEVTLVRVVALVLLFVTGGGMILLYAVLMLLIPYAALDPKRPDPRRIPAKLREWMVAIRSKLDHTTR